MSRNKIYLYFINGFIYSISKSYLKYLHVWYMECELYMYLQVSIGYQEFWCNFTTNNSKVNINFNNFILFWNNFLNKIENRKKNLKKIETHPISVHKKLIN